MPEKFNFTNQEQVACAQQMLTQMRGQLLQAFILERVMVRKKLAGKLSVGEMNLDGENRQKISMLGHSIEHLEAIHSELVAEGEKDK